MTMLLEDIQVMLEIQDLLLAPVTTLVPGTHRPSCHSLESCDI